MGRYIGVIAPSILALIGGLFAVFHRYKTSIAMDIKETEHNVELEIAKVWAEIRNVLALQSTHISEIAVLKVEQRNTWTRLEEIKSMVHETNKKIDALFKEVVRRVSGREL